MKDQIIRLMSVRSFIQTHTHTHTHKVNTKSDLRTEVRTVIRCKVMQEDYPCREERYLASPPWYRAWPVPNETKCS